MTAMRKHLRPGGMACITIRPFEYWNWYSSPDNAARQPGGADLERQHHQSGFAFIPHLRQPIAGEITFGNTSMTIDWFARNIPDWRIVGHDHSPDDIMQRFLFLRGV
jgi:hypothetical protein